LQDDNQTFEVRLSDESFETYELDPPQYTLDTTKAELKQTYYDMVAVRYESPTRIRQEIVTN
jgi:pyruvate dehydrogenase E1 component alpha subunit